jgi:RNA polymerase sigma-70 factor (ECF subfamily)
MDASDAELMGRTRSGDLEALGTLFERHQPAIHAFLHRFLGDASAAEDAVQEVFWRVWQHRSTYDGRCGFTAWLYVIARHAALDEIRRRNRHATPFSGLRDGQEEQLGTTELAIPGSEASVRRLALREQVRAALLQLPPEQRTCLLLREYEAKSHREIAEILGCSEANARVLTHRARQALRRLLQPMLESERRESEESCV